MIREFASPMQMSERTQGEITTASHPHLYSELVAATKAIRNVCHWHIASREALIYQRTRPRAEQVWLPAMEIVSLDAVELDGMMISPGTVAFDADTGWTALFGRQVRIAYTAGYLDVPDDLVTLTLELAAGGLGTSLNITREQAGGVSVTYGRVSGALTPADRDRLAPYTIGAVP